MLCADSAGGGSVFASFLLATGLLTGAPGKTKNHALQDHFMIGDTRCSVQCLNGHVHEWNVKESEGNEWNVVV